MEASKAQGGVPQAIEAASGGGKDAGTAIAVTAINIYAQKQSAAKNAAEINAEFGTLITNLEAELKAANATIDGLYQQITGLEDEILQLTLEINSLSGGEVKDDEEV